MLVYLLRHANADTPAPPNDDRVLTEKGHAQSRQVAEFCLSHGLRPAVILTSPLHRAHQTAEPVAQALGGELLVAPWLASGMHPETAVEELRAYRSFESVMLVGHEPDFSRLGAHLLGLPSHNALHLRKASLTLLDLPVLRAGAATLKSTLPCQLM